MTLFSHFRPALVMIVFMTIVLGLAYPFAMTGIARVAFRHQAEGSLVRDASGQVVGSSLIAQAFTKPEYLHPRGSAAGMGYDASNSSGSNLGPMDQKLIDRVKTDTAALRKEAPGVAIPPDAVTTSGSGLDPDISPAYAHLQAPRIAAARGAPVSAVDRVIADAIRPRALGVLGEPTVNVLAVNLKLDADLPKPPHRT